jgi:hypothetical protein
MKKAKAPKEKEPAKKPRKENYDSKLGVTGSFFDVMKAAAKHADTKKDEKKP